MATLDQEDIRALDELIMKRLREFGFKSVAEQSVDLDMQYLVTLPMAEQKKILKLRREQACR